MGEAAAVRICNVQWPDDCTPGQRVGNYDDCFRYRLSSSAGGTIGTSLLTIGAPNLRNAGLLHASTIGEGNASRSEASLANLALTAGGVLIEAGFSEVARHCSLARATATSEILVINEQIVSSAGIPVNAINSRSVLPARPGNVRYLSHPR